MFTSRFRNAVVFNIFYILKVIISRHLNTLLKIILWDCNEKFSLNQHLQLIRNGSQDYHANNLTFIIHSTRNKLPSRKVSRVFYRPQEILSPTI